MKRIIPLLLTLLALSACAAKNETSAEIPEMMPLVEQQLEFGPRTPGSEAHDNFATWACGILTDAGWETTAETKTYRGKEVRNIIAERSSDSKTGKRILIGAHYDSRLHSDRKSVV